MIFIRNIWLSILLTVLAQTVCGTTWRAAYPYTQKIDGQNVVVKAIPYDPFSGSPMIGVTKVYLENKLLYTIDKYYREKIFTSNDGQYLVIVHTSNIAGIASYNSRGIERLNFNQIAIEVFKNGQPFKIFAIKDVLDTTTLQEKVHNFNWFYSVDFEAFQSAEFGCQACCEVYGRKVIRTGDTSEIDLDDWEECKRECDSSKFKSTAIHISENAIYVQGNSLFVLTNLNKVIKLDFAEMTIQQIAFEKVIPNVYKFNPPALKRKFKKIKYPKTFLLPDLYNGKTIEQGLADLFHINVSNRNQDSISFIIYIHTLLINSEGKCERVYVSPRIRGDFKNELVQIGNEEKLKEIIEGWIKQQTFNTSTIPKGFLKYNYDDFVYLR